jgi:hypothetical protein
MNPNAILEPPPFFTMNTDPLTTLATRLAKNPTLLVEAEELALRDLLLDHSAGLLEPANATDAEALIQNDPLAASIWAEFQQIDEHLKTDAGKQWLDATPERQLTHFAQSEPSPDVVGGHVQTPSKRWTMVNSNLLSRLSDKASDIMESFQSLLAPRQTILSCSTDAVPIYGKAGPNDEIMFTMRPTSSGHTEISLSTKIEAWNDLTVSLGEHQPQKIRLEQVGDRWAGSLEFPLSFAVLGSQRPNIRVQNT